MIRSAPGGRLAKLKRMLSTTSWWILAVCTGVVADAVKGRTKNCKAVSSLADAMVKDWRIENDSRSGTETQS